MHSVFVADPADPADSADSADSAHRSHPAMMALRQNAATLQRAHRRARDEETQARNTNAGGARDRSE
jgi:hypothetical protein